MMEEKLSIVPAAPGYDLIEGVLGEDGEISELAFTPIVAWATSYGERMSSTQPITIAITDHDTETFIRTPDGRFYNWEGLQRDDEASILRELQEVRKLRRP